MTIRRIVTEELEGRSRIASDGDAPHTWCHELWTTTSEDPLGFDPGPTPRPIAPPPHSTILRIVELPPDEVVRAGLEQAEQLDGVDREGFHRTPTVDYVLVLDGPVDLVLDDGSVTVQPGDVVIQRSTNHAWRNHGQSAIRLVTFMVGLE